MAAIRYVPEGRDAVDFPIEATLQVPSGEWLKEQVPSTTSNSLVHGLCACGLSLDQLLPTLGFQQSKGDVSSLGRSVSSQYGEGMFVRQENSTGQVYNICETNGEKLASIEEELKDIVVMLKSRYEWLTTGSRLTFGTLCGRDVVMVIDIDGSEHAQLKSLLDVASSVIKEQVVHIDRFNVLRVSGDVGIWREGLVNVTEETTMDAVEWVGQTTPQTPPLTANIVQGISKALEHTEADSIYLLSYGESSLRAYDQLLERVSPSMIPLSVSVFNCEQEEGLERYRSLASASNGRCHSYTPPPHSPLTAKKSTLLSSFSSVASAGSKSPPLSSRRPASGQSHTSRPPSASNVVTPVSSFHHGPNDKDTEVVWEELESARNTLAQIQALRIELGGACYNSCPDVRGPCNDSKTTEQWLVAHGLKENKLMFEDLVRSLAFKHCNGIVQIPLPPKHKRTEKVEMISQPKVVHAQYCKEFVHMRWPEGGVIHIQLSDHAHKVYCKGVKKVVEMCQERLASLKDGSRELFGTLLEDKIVIVVDTSVSMAKRLGMLKEKLQQLIQEQLSSKDQFTVMCFNSKVYPWRENLVPSSPQALSAVSQWVEGLVTEGSTNTQDALIKAMSVGGAQAVYLMTDGRPDSPTDTLLAKVQQLPKIPVHTISFNCADSNANHFLAKLSSNTGGRYYYLSTDVSDPEGPKTYQSEDICHLEEEIKCGEEQLQRAHKLLAECHVTRRRSGKTKSQVPSKKKARKAMKKNREESDTDSCTSHRSPKVKPLMSSKKWLSKNSLSSLKLTLMDALGPTAIPHTSKHVPLLQKNVPSKVFNYVFPLAHVANDNRVTLINPNGVNLIDYESKLDKQVVVYWNRLSRLAWVAIPSERKPSILTDCRLEDDQTPSYKEHRELLNSMLKELGWPRPQVDFDLLEEEIRLAESYRQYSVSLREEGSSRPRPVHSQLRSGSRGRDLRSDSVLDMYSYTSGGSLVALVDQFQLHTTTSSRPPQVMKGRGYRPSKGQKVIARSKEDGFYYPGVVTGQTDSNHATVKLADGKEMPVFNSLIIPVGGARPCPKLQYSNHVLVRVRTKNNGLHPTADGRCDFYVPGTVRVLPENERKGHALYSVLVFNGKTIMSDRRGIVKINEKCYNDTCKFVRARISGGGSGIRPCDDDDIHSCTSCRSSVHMPRFSLTQSEQSEAASQVSSPLTSDHEAGRSGGSSDNESGTTAVSRISSIKEDQSNCLSDEAHVAKEQHDLSSLVQSQKAQGELIEQYHNELVLLQDKQREMEAQLTTSQREKEVNDNVKTSSQFEVENSATMLDGVDLDDFPDTEPAAQTMLSHVHSREITPVSPPATTCLTGTVHVTQCDQGVNTDPMTEDKSVGTGPMMESRGVGTDWSHSESDSSGDSDNDELAKQSDGHSVNHSPPPSSLQLTPVHVPTPSNTPSPPHSHTSTPAHESPPHSHTSSPAHKSLPHSHTSSPAHESPPHSHTSPLHTVTSHNNSSRQLTAANINPYRDVPLISQQVLARWPDDGWYYRCMLVRVMEEDCWEVEDASGDKEVIPLSDIIMDLLDSQRPLSLGDYVTALHPDYAYSYAPGQIAGIAADGLHFTVNLYDGSQTVLPRQEVYSLPESKHDSDVQYLKRKEREWVGMACIARKDSDGLYYPGKVESQVEGTRNYLISWASGRSQVQEVVHIYGQLIRKRPLRIGDYVLGLADQNQGVCMPGVISGTQQKNLIIEFCDGQCDAVDPTHCFWISHESYQHAVEYICAHAPPPSEGVMTTVTDEQSDSGSDNFID